MISGWKLLPLIITGMLIPWLGGSQNMPAYRDASLSPDDRAHDLLHRMSTEEKFRQLFMIPGDLSIGREKLHAGIFGFSLSSKGLTGDGAGQMLQYDASAPARYMAVRINEIHRFFRDSTRLGIPVIMFDEALHGLIREGATAFPQSIGLAATFDTALMRQVARAIARETRSRGIRMVLFPVINIARDVRWGRTEETYGEDPFLTSLIGTAYISEFEKAGIITTPKHFAVNSGDGGRDSYPVHYNERIMEELYFPAFKSAVLDGGARSVMTAYNSFDGTPCTSNEWLLRKKLKEEWKFRGFVISDACATGGANVLHMTSADYEEAGKVAVENGLDVIFQTDFNHIELFKGPFEQGHVEPRILDSAVFRVLRAKFELGLFEDPFTDEVAASRINGCQEHRQLALQAARESIVLLKNDNKLLPIAPSVRSIAVIGADAAEARLGGYSGPGIDKITILDGIKQLAGDSIRVMFSPGCGRTSHASKVIPQQNLLVPGVDRNGLQADYYKNIRFADEPALRRIDPVIDFYWSLYAPDGSLANNWYSARWQGKLKPSGSGFHRIGMEGNDGFRLYLNNKLIIDRWTKRSYSATMTGMFLSADSLYDLKAEFYEPHRNGRIRLVWDEGLADTSSIAIKKAVEAAGSADMVVFVAGIEEGEFRDRSSLELPGRQVELLQALIKTGKPLVVVIVGGSAVTMSSWLDEVNAVIDVWYPGEAGGLACAEVLFGKYNPAGRLPVTFPVSEGQLPLVYNHKPTGRGDDYLDLSGEPLFPFGFGLSYSEFQYNELKIINPHPKSGESVKISFHLKNTGYYPGDEVWQLYLHDRLASVARPLLELKGFGRVTLLPGEEKQIEFVISPESFSMLDKNMDRVIEPGEFDLLLGASSRDIRLRGVINLQP